MRLLLLALLACGPKLPSATPSSTSPVAPGAAPAPGVAPAPSSTPAAESTPGGAPASGSPDGATTSGATGGGAATESGTGATGAASPQGAAWDEPTGGNEKALSDAVAMLTTGDASRARAALDLLRPLTAQFPDVAAIPYNIGVAQHILGDDTEARRAWLRATEVDPTFARAWLNLGALSVTRGSYEAALSSFQAGIRQNPGDISLRVAAISALRSMRRYSEAVGEAKAALQINSRAIEIYNQLGLVYIETGQTDLAKFMCFKAMEAVEGAENNPQLQANFGQIYLKEGYTGDALEAFGKALGADPNQLTALQFLSGYYLDNRNFDEALPLLERIVGLLPNEPGPRVNVGIAYRGQGRYEDAIKAYNEALRLNPASGEPHRNLAVLYGDYMKAYDAAIDEIEAYRRAGGGPPAELDAWAAQLRKDKEKGEKKKKKEEDSRRKAEEEARRAAEEAGRAEEEARQAAEAARIAAEEEARRAAQPPPAPETPAPETPSPSPAPESSPAPEGSDPSPWGGGP